MPRVRTDPDLWEEVSPLIPDFMLERYESCEGQPFCGTPARYVLSGFLGWLHASDPEKYTKSGLISYHSFYNELRRLGYDLPVAKGFDSKTRVNGIRKITT